MAAVLGLPHTNSRVSITSISSFAANLNTQMAYKQFFKVLHQIGVTEDTIHQKEDEILKILKSQGMVASNQIDGSHTGSHGQLLEAGHFLLYVQSLTYQQIIILGLQQLSLRLY